MDETDADVVLSRTSYKKEGTTMSSGGGYDPEEALREWERTRNEVKAERETEDRQWSQERTRARSNGDEEYGAHLDAMREKTLAQRKDQDARAFEKAERLNKDIDAKREQEQSRDRGDRERERGRGGRGR